ncbi:MAG: hypothetical protein AAF726_22700 [Planctomycetota bacterium]
MRSAVLLVLALVTACSDPGGEIAVSAGESASDSRVVRIEPYGFDPVVERLFDVSAAVRVRAPGPQNDVAFRVVAVDASGNTSDGGHMSETPFEGDLDVVVTTELQTHGSGDERSYEVVVRAATKEGDRGVVMRSDVDQHVPETVGAITSGSSTTATRRERGEAHVLREWGFTEGTTSRRIRLEMTVDEPD